LLDGAGDAGAGLRGYLMGEEWWTACARAGTIPAPNLEPPERGNHKEAESGGQETEGERLGGDDGYGCKGYGNRRGVEKGGGRIEAEMDNRTERLHDAPAGQAATRTNADHTLIRRRRAEGYRWL